jgi:RimJ/RimL family protein N-acetyltransferase
MSGHEPTVQLRAWSEDDLPLLEQTMGDAAMTEHLGGPETPDQLARRQQRYLALRDSGIGDMLVIVSAPDAMPVGTVGYWEKEWRDQTVWEVGWAVLPAFQGQGIATRGTALAIERARSEGRHRFMHAFPAVDNVASNGICRKLGFTLLDERDFEYPKGHWMRCNDWRLDLENA